MVEERVNPQAKKVIQFDVEDLRPDPVKTQHQHKTNMMVASGSIAICLGAVAYMGARTFKKDPFAITAVAALVGGIFGAYAGVRKKTYEERAYALAQAAFDEGADANGMKKMLIKELKQRDKDVSNAMATGVGRF